MSLKKLPNTCCIEGCIKKNTSEVCIGAVLYIYYTHSTHTSLVFSISLSLSRSPSLHRAHSFLTFAPTLCHSLSLNSDTCSYAQKTFAALEIRKGWLCSMFLYFVSIVYVYLHALVHEIDVVWSVCV